MSVCPFSEYTEHRVHGLVLCVCGLSIHPSPGCLSNVPPSSRLNVTRPSIPLYTDTYCPVEEERATDCPRVNCVPILSMANQTLCPFPGECHFLGIRWGISIIFLPRSSLFDKKLETSNAMRKVVNVLIDRLKPKCST